MTLLYGEGIYGGGIYDGPSVVVPPPPRRPPTRWAFAVGAWSGMPDTALPQITSRSVTLRLIGNSEAAFTIDGRAAQAGNIHELISDLSCFRNGQVMFRGRVGASSDTVSADSHTVTFSAADYRALLARQILYDTDTLTYTSAGDDAIVTALIHTVQARLSLGIIVSTHGTAKTLPSTVFPAGQSVGDAITQLAAGSPGFDWDVTPLNAMGYQVLNVWYPQRGADRQVILDYPGAIQSLTRQADPGAFANALRVTGGTGLAPVAVSEAGIASDPAGRWDSQIGDTSILTSTQLASYAAKQLATSQQINPAWTVTLAPNSWGGPDHIGLGDPVTLSVQSGRLNVVETLRVYEIAVMVDDASETETVALTLGAVKPDRRWLPRRIDKRLSALERR